MIPLIAIPCRRVSDSKVGIPVVGIRTSYLEALIACGAVPLPVVLGLDESSCQELLKSCGGVLLTGGEDVDPKEYGESPHPKLGTVSAERDELELFVARWALREKKPILAICRGIQLLNVACGGTLIQDIPSQAPSDVIHSAASVPGAWSQCSHDVILEPESKLASILGGTNTIGANSMHHQAIKDLGSGLVVVGRSSDGLIEAVEGAAKDQFVIGVQSHPETLWNSSEPRWQKLFTAFVAAASAT